MESGKQEPMAGICNNTPDTLPMAGICNNTPDTLPVAGICNMRSSANNVFYFYIDFYKYLIAVESGNKNTPDTFQQIHSKLKQVEDSVKRLQTDTGDQSTSLAAVKTQVGLRTTMYIVTGEKIYRPRLNMIFFISVCFYFVKHDIYN